MATIPIITNASDLIRRLTAALMQYPRQSDAKPDVLGQFCKFFTPTVQQSKQLSVAGVATRGIDQVHLFCHEPTLAKEKHSSQVSKRDVCNPFISTNLFRPSRTYTTYL